MASSCICELARVSVDGAGVEGDALGNEVAEVGARVGARLGELQAGAVLGGPLPSRSYHWRKKKERGGSLLTGFRFGFHFSTASSCSVRGNTEVWS
mgnify:CR=1 FL=1